MAPAPGVRQWWLRSAMEMPVPSPRRSLKLVILIATIVLLLSLLLFKPEHLSAEGANGVPQRYNPDLGTDGVHWKGKSEPDL